MGVGREAQIGGGSALGGGPGSSDRSNKTAGPDSIRDLHFVFPIVLSNLLALLDHLLQRLEEALTVQQTVQQNTYCIISSRRRIARKLCIYLIENHLT